jgi:hypothetical protein
MADPANDDQDAQTVHAGNTPTQGPPAAAPTFVLVPHVQDPKVWFNQQEPGFDEAERDYLLNTASAEDGGFRLAKELPKRYTPAEVAFEAQGVARKQSRQRGWEIVGVWLMTKGRFFESLAVFNALYEHMIVYNITEKKRRAHKGMPLIYMSECFRLLRYPVHSKRYLMHTLCEDAVAYGREKRSAGSGVYFRAVVHHGMSEQMVVDYTRLVHDKALELGENGWFPERLLVELDDRWMTDSPSEEEFGRYWCNRLYVEHLMSGLGSTAGQALERLAHYLLSMIPGCRAYPRQ